MEDGKAIFLPTKSEKRLSNSPASLLKSKNLPCLREVDGVMVGALGNEVTYFINGVKADKIDISTFWPKDVRRVEYIENPSDPTFEGCKSVVNFILDEYEIGGVTKIDLFQRVPNHGSYSISSKLVRKKLTLGSMFWGNYTRLHGTSLNGSEVYRDIFYDGTKYGVLTRDFEEHQYERENWITYTFNAKYATSKFRATHAFSFAWVQNPGSGSNSADKWSENLFNSQKSSSYSEGKTLTPQFSGNYYAALSDKWTLSGRWLYSFANNESSSWNQYQPSQVVSNEVKEDVHSLSAVLMPTFMLSPKWVFQLRTQAAFDWFSSNYSGTTSTKQNLSRQELSSDLGVYWMPSSSFGISVKPGLSASMSNVGGVKQHTIRPTAEFAVNATISPKVSFSGTTRFLLIPADASDYNSVMLKESELKWVMGNPHIRNLTAWNTYIYTSFILAQWLNLSWGFGYDKSKNTYINTYTPASPDAGGMVRRSDNAEPTHRVINNFIFSGNFFDNKLSVEVCPTWTLYKTSGAYATTFGHISASGNINYTISDFRFAIEYEGPFKALSLAGMEKSWTHDKWHASLTYGNGNFYVMAKVENIFNKKSSSWEILETPYYSSNSFKRATGRSIFVNFTYTFGYGKKVSQDIDISSAEDVKTSVLRSAGK